MQASHRKSTIDGRISPDSQSLRINCSAEGLLQAWGARNIHSGIPDHPILPRV
jgi:hypothetical protein